MSTQKNVDIQYNTEGNFLGCLVTFEFKSDKKVPLRARVL